MIPQRLGYPCECGCGETAKVGNRYINHHALEFKYSNKGKHHTDEWKLNNSKLHKGKVTSEETKRKMSLVAKGRNMSIPVKVSADLRRGTKHTNATKEKMARAHKGKNNHFFGKKHTEEAKRKNSKWHKKAYTDPEYKKMVIENAMLGKKNRAIINEQLKPNKPESKLLDFLALHHPKEWKYVGDGSVVFGSKNPDFINVNGKKLIIELFGDYWHRNDSVRKRMAVFKPFGFRTLVVWERELKNQKALIKKINRFVNY